MKRLLICSLLMAGLTFFNSCRKEDNPRIPSLIQVPVPVMQLDPSSDPFISPVDPASFHAKFTVEKLFENDITPQKIDIVVMKNGNTGTVKPLKADVTTLPATIEVKGQDLINLFGPIGGGDQFDIGSDITLSNGQKYVAFPATGTSYASGVVTEIGNVKPGAVTSLSFLMPCPFNADAYNDNFVVISDEWKDYAPGTVIPVTKISATQISFKYNVDPGTAKPIVMTIDPATNAITVTRQLYGSYGGTQVYAESVPGPSSAVNPCDLSLSVRLKHTDASGATTFDITTIKLQKQ